MRGQPTLGREIVVFMGFVVCAILLGMAHVPRAADDVPFWVGFLKPRAAVNARKYIRAITGMIVRLPFFGSAMFAMTGVSKLLAHMRGRGSIPWVTDGVLVVVTLGLQGLMMHTPVWPGLLVAQGAELGYGADDALFLARSVSIGLVIFVSGRLLGSTLLSYFGLALIAWPVVKPFAEAGAEMILDMPSVPAGSVLVAAVLLTCSLLHFASIFVHDRLSAIWMERRRPSQHKSDY